MVSITLGYNFLFAKYWIASERELQYMHQKKPPPPLPPHPIKEKKERKGFTASNLLNLIFQISNAKICCMFKAGVHLNLREIW